MQGSARPFVRSLARVPHLCAWGISGTESGLASCKPWFERIGKKGPLFADRPFALAGACGVNI